MKPDRHAPQAYRAPFVEVSAEARVNRALPGTRLWWLELALPASFPAPSPGQFVMLTPPGASLAGLLLPRPFSIARAVREGDGWRLGILYARVGRGTDLMSRGARGAWTVIGPLGRGFPLDERGPALLVAGGRGTAPLVFLAEWLEAHGRGADFLIGARGREDWAGPEEMGATLTKTRVWAATEDGSRGMKGRVLGLFEHHPELGDRLAQRGAHIHSCGPHGLLAAAGTLGEGLGVPVYASIEAHMACGTGICRTCMVPRDARGPKPRRGQNASYLVTCLEGPVVPASCVDWTRDRESSPATPYVPADEPVLVEPRT